MADTPPADTSPRAFVRSYYDTLRSGDPLTPFFADTEPIVKFGISETLRGGEAVADGLREQTETTAEWTVESHALTADQHGEVAWFADDVALAWTDTDRGRRLNFETRWSGTLERTDGWQFVGMHVSTAGEL